MFISQHLRQENIAEYLLYMWQVEDLIRANNFDIEKIKENIISKYQLSDEEKEKLTRWYEDLINMMREEGVMEKGHLQINKNVLQLLTDLHKELLASAKQPFYGAAYFKALPYIVDLRNRSGKTDEPELETCFEALYGVMLLRLQKKEVSGETLKAMGEITKLVSLLANFYDKDKKGELEL